MSAEPSDHDAELDCIGAIFLAPDGPFVSEAFRDLDPEDFYVATNRVVFRAQKTLHGTGAAPTQTLVVGHLDDHHVELVDGKSNRDVVRGVVERLGGIDGVGVAPTALRDYVKRIREKSYQREAGRDAARLLEATRNGQPVDDAVQAAVARLRSTREIHTPVESRTTFRTFSDLKAYAEAGVPWLLRHFVATEAITLIGGHPKSGKSWWVYALLAALQRGDEEFCGQRIHRPSSAIVFTEDPASSIREKGLYFGLDDSHLFLTEKDAHPRRPLAERVEDALKQRGDRLVLVIDTLREWAQLPPKAENDAGAIREALEPLKIARAQGMAVIVNHHLRKGDGEDGTGFAGSGAIFGMVDIGVSFKKFRSSKDDGEESKARLVTLAGSKWEGGPAEIVVELVDGGFAWRGSAKEARSTLREAAIVACLVRLNRFVLVEELAEALGLAKRTLENAISGIHRAGKIHRVGPGTKAHPFLYAALDVPLQSAPTTT